MKDSFDLIVVGAGILGAFAAFHARKRGKSVLLLDAGHTPRGATVRSFGQVVPSGQSLQGWRALGIRSMELYLELAEKLNIQVQRNGSLYVASDSDEQILLTELSEIDRGMGYVSERLTAAQCLERIPWLQSDYAKEGLFYPQEITLYSPNFLPTFLAWLGRNSNVQLLSGKVVIEVESKESVGEVRLASGEPLRVAQVLVCCGHRLHRIGGVEVPADTVRLVRLQMLASKPQPAGIIPGNLMTGLTIRRYDAFRSCTSFARVETPERLQPVVDAGSISLPNSPQQRIDLGRLPRLLRLQSKARH